MKSVVAPVHFIQAQSLGSSFNSSTITLLQADIASIQLNYTGSPTGSISIMGSLDGVNFASLYFNLNGSVTNSVVLPAATSPIIIDLTQIAIPYVRVSYTYSSGSGSMDGYFSSKRLGD